MDYTNVKYFLLNQVADEPQEIMEDYAEEMMRSGCFEKHTCALYCGENTSRMWLDETIYNFETLEFLDEAAELLTEKYFITKTAALEIMNVAITETKQDIHTQLILLKVCGG